jgi:cyclase
MSLKKRIVPLVLLDGFSVVKTKQFKERRNLGNPITVARTYNSRNVDELIILDIDASAQSRAIDLLTIRDIATECFMPLTVGGGLRDLNDIGDALKFGADKVALNTAILNSPKLIREAAETFGSQAIVASIDVIETEGQYFVYSSKFPDLQLLACDWAQRCAQMGAGELLINMTNLDGTMNGADISFASLISELVSIPVIYAGGISGAKDCCALGRTSVTAIGAAAVFHFTSTTPLDCKTAMDAAGINVRLI